MKALFAKFGLTGDRVLWGLLAVLAVIVLGSILFSPPQLPLLPQAPGDASPVTSETMEGRVTRVLSQEEIATEGGPQYVQQIEVEIISGDLKGQKVITEHGDTIVTARSSLVKPGMRVIVEHTVGPAGERFYISDFIRRPAIFWLTVLFVVVTVLVGRLLGARSLLGLAFSVLVIVQFILPRILAGQNAVGVCIAGALVLMAPSLYIVYGWRKKTHAAVLGMGISLVVTWILAAVFVSWAHVTGFGSEETAFLVVASPVELDPRGLILGGIILGTLGMLDDVAVSLASAVFELHATNPSLSWVALFRHSMVIGIDHIASMVNSLMMAYVGASLPLFLLLTLYREPLGFLLNRELLVEEIIRTLVGSLGIMTAGPATSLIACWMVRGKIREIGK